MRSPRNPHLPTKPALLPVRIRDWFASRGWQVRAHQAGVMAAARAGRSALVIAPTGAGKTLAGVLPTLADRLEGHMAERGLHTLYVSPLKALAVDVARNLDEPAAEMGLGLRIETRTGDTPAAKRRRQRQDPPHILLTTPEQVALLLSDAGAPRLFGDLKRIVIDEAHALAPTKRGDLLALGLARLRRLAPGATVTGLSATVKEPEDLARWLAPEKVEIISVAGGVRPEIIVHETGERLPWSGHAARHAVPAIYDEIRRHRTTLVFVNTRFIAEFLFQELWRLNEDNLAIALHHGSLAVEQRRKVEAAMAAGKLRAVVCTSTLDLGIDWGDVDLVVHMGSPKGSSRLLQRIGRANHRLDEPSRAIIVPGSRFEVIECEATKAEALAGHQDTEPLRPGGLDILAQHVLGMACAAPFDADALYGEVRGALPYAGLSREDFDAVVDFVATGGYALKTYERFAKIRKTADGLWRVSTPAIAKQYRMNIGAIVESAMLRVLLQRGGSRPSGATGPVGRGGRVLGEVEEYFIEGLVAGDTFVFGGEILKFEGIVQNEVFVSRSSAEAPKVPSYAGGKMPMTTDVAGRVRAILADPASWDALPAQVREWLEIQRVRSVLPGRDELLVETFPRAGKHFLVAYPFEGRLAHQTLGMLLTRRMERAGLRPLGFVATDYSLAVWGLSDVSAHIATGMVSLESLFSEDMLGDDLEEWLLESSLMKRTFRSCAVISGLIERRYPGQEKTGRQVTISTDLIYDVLRKHEPDHLLLRAARADAARGLIDVARVAHMLRLVRGRIRHCPLSRISPLAVPVLLEIGREPVSGAGQEALLLEAEEMLAAEAMGDALV